MDPPIRCEASGDDIRDTQAKPYCSVAARPGPSGSRRGGRQGAADAVGGALGAVGGRFGLGGRRAEPATDPELVVEAPAAQPLFRMTTSRENIARRNPDRTFSRAPRGAARQLPHAVDRDASTGSGWRPRCGFRGSKIPRPPGSGRGLRRAAKGVTLVEVDLLSVAWTRDAVDPERGDHFGAARLRGAAVPAPRPPHSAPRTACHCGIDDTIA
jgi:hypothetical protein